MENSLIQTSHLNFKYQEEYILKDINFTINRNEFVVILGPRGEGKSTLLKVMAGLFLIEEGDVFYDSVNLRKIPKKELMAIHRRTSFVFQDAALISNIRVFDNLALPLRYNQMNTEEEIRVIIYDLLDKVGLLNVKDLLPAFISLGQRRILATLRAILVNPETIFYDEPLANLDKPSRSMIRNIIRDTLKKNITSIVVSHEFDEFKDFVTHVIVLKDRTVYRTGTLDEILNTSDEYIKSLIS
ncbi:MAG: ATP-binding cassette domain-containing protein [bacterium]|nr:ATP-binding cassette domain-containing protein [bacterium]